MVYVLPLWRTFCFLFTLTLFSTHTCSKELHLVTIEHAPHSFVEKETVVGGVTQLVREIFHTLGYRLEITSVPAKRALIMVEEGLVDGVYPYTYSESRGNSAYFSNPIAVIDTVFFKKKSTAVSWKTFADLYAYRIGSNAGYQYPTAFQLAERDGLINTDPLFSQNPTLDNLHKLESRRIDLFICNKLVCQFYIEKYAPKFQDIDYIAKPVGPLNVFHVGFTRKMGRASDVREQFNKALDETIKSGLLVETYDRWGMKAEVSLLGSQGAEAALLRRKGL